MKSEALRAYERVLATIERMSTETANDPPRKVREVSSGALGDYEKLLGRLEEDAAVTEDFRSLDAPCVLKLL